MTDYSIDNYSNWYLNGAQGAYTGRYDRLSYPNVIRKDRFQEIDYTNPTSYQNSNLTGKAREEDRERSIAIANTGKTIYAKDASGNPITVSSDGKLYLQPDNVFMSDSSTGFNAYVVTNTPTIQADSHVLFAVRGSDGFGESLNPDPQTTSQIQTDWLDNDFRFTLNNARIPQANDGKAALQQLIDGLPAGVTELISTAI